MQQITSSQISFHPQSFCDPYGRVFWWNGQLYRGINSEHGAFFKQLFETGLIQTLVDRELLVETDITALSFEQYGMVVRHRSIPFVSYAHEWCAQMLREAAITVVDLLLELAHHKLSLRDPHPWNILFDSYKPLYVDLTSIIPIRQDFERNSYQEFCKFFLYPLILMTHEQERIARWLLWDYEGIQKKEFMLLTQNITSSDSVFLAYLHVRSVLRQRILQLRRKFPIGRMKNTKGLFDRKPSIVKSQLFFLENLRKNLEDIRLPTPTSDSLTKDKHYSVPFSSQEEMMLKSIYLKDVLAKLRPSSVLTIGDLTPEYSELAANLGAKVVSINKDPTYSSQLYNNAFKKNLSILPLVMDFLKPTPSFGLASHWFVDAAERLRCEMVLAFGLVYQIVLERYLTFEQIVSGLSLFAKKWLIVDFTPYDDQILTQYQLKNRLVWYTPENFVSSLRKYFNSVSVIASSSHSHQLFLCEK